MASQWTVSFRVHIQELFAKTVPTRMATNIPSDFEGPASDRQKMCAYWAQPRQERTPTPNVADFCAAGKQTAVHPKGQ